MIIPPDTTDEEFDIKWEEISSSVNAFPVEYTLTARGDELDIPLLPMVCHRVKVQRYKQNSHTACAVPYLSTYIHCLVH